MTLPIKEYIQFGTLNTKNYGLYLETREADMPSEDEQVESIPYRQGEEDFGFLTGERIFKQRTIKYTFVYPNASYTLRKRVENDVKREFVPLFNTKLIDSHDPGYYWIGKVSSIKATDDATKGLLKIDFTFSVYPFAFKDTGSEESDVWDGFDFELDILQPSVFKVNGYREITLYNNGTNSITPLIYCNTDIQIDVGGQMYQFNPNKTEDYWLKMPVGKMTMKIYANDTVRVVLRQEVML